MLRKLTSLLTAVFSPEKHAGTQLTPLVDPKVPNKQQSQASFSKRTATTQGAQRVAAADRRTANLDLLSLRNGQTTKSTIHDLAAVSPDLSASVFAYQRLVVTRGYTGVARNQDGTANPEATTALQQIIARFNYFTDYTEGFTTMNSIHSAAEVLAKELRLYGACAMELVLDKARLPHHFQGISTTQIDFWEDNSGVPYPVQRIAGQQINLDIPTFFYESLDQDLLSAYSDSPMESAIQATLQDAEFTNDLRRSIKRALHPRLTATIDYELFRKYMPLEAVGDTARMTQYQNDFIEKIANTVNGLEPDDALVSFSTTKYDYLNNGNVTLSKEWEALQAMTDAKLATGTKAPPAVLGHGAGSQNVASTETMLFVRYAEGIQQKINSIFSRALTLGVRLLGYDVYVEFAFDRIDLRPDSELEAFRSMKQERVLEQLSFGFITDEEASLALTGKLPPAGFKPLSGTQFTVNKVAQGAGNPTSNTSNGQGALGQDQQPGTPQQKKGPVTRVK